MMKQLTCEMCGSTDLMKQDGVYVCQTCGTKYSVEEAKRMMIEGVVEVAGTVKVDNTDRIENYIMMAENAYKADNKRETESYCNKILEIEPENYKAWLLKGKAAGWQSTLRNIRIEESVNCWKKAIDYSPEEKLKEIKADVAKEITSISKALMQMCCDNFENYPSNDNKLSIINNLKSTNIFLLSLLKKCDVSPKTFNKEVAAMIDKAAMNAWYNKCQEDYCRDSHPSKYVWQKYVEQGTAVIELLELAVSISEADGESNQYRYSKLINIQTQLIKSAAWKYDSTFDWVIEERLYDTSSRRNKIMQWHKKWNELDSSHVIPTMDTIQSDTKEASDGTLFVCCATIVTVIAVIIFSFL